MIRPSAAVLLFRGPRDDPAVFLAERSPRLRFLGGYHAFPGGVLEEPDAGSLAACARRELAEETGVSLEVTDLAPVCRILTPPFAPVRYQTEFFSAPVPAGQEPAVDGAELVRGAFVRPAAALHRWRAGELRIAPPVLILLELLCEHGLAGFPAAAAALAERFAAGMLPPVRFSPGVVMASLATPTIPPATTTNCYIVGTERLHVIDPAAPDPAEQARLLDLLDRQAAGGARVESVLLTHHHPDHVGAAAAVAARHDVTVRGHARTLDRLPDGVPRGAPLADGDVLPLGRAPDGGAGWHLRVLFTPGHAQGHLCFQEDRYGALVAGDLVSTVSTIVIDPPEGHLATYLASLARVRDLPIGTLYPAHGPPVPGGRQVLERYLAHRAEREAKLVAALGSGAGTIAELLPLVYDDVPVAIHALAARSLQAGLDKLAEEGRAQDAGGRWLPV